MSHARPARSRRERPMVERDQGVGIDFGTSNSAVCRVDTGKGYYDFQLARDGQLTEVPSAVAQYRGQLYFGPGAVRKEAADPNAVLRNFKALLRENEDVTLWDRTY